MNKSDTIKEIAAAMLRFQSEVNTVIKAATNPFFKSKYADLPQILETIKEPLKNAGLSFMQFPKGVNELETIIMHTSGEWMSETYTMNPVKNDPQAFGSVITYQRRYALVSILGLNTDEDDDGNAATHKEPTKKHENLTSISAADFSEIMRDVLDMNPGQIYSLVEDLKKQHTLTADQQEALKAAYNTKRNTQKQ